MNRFKKLLKKYLWLAAPLAIVFLIVPQLTHGESLSIIDAANPLAAIWHTGGSAVAGVAGNLITGVTAKLVMFFVLIINYILSAIAAILFSLASWFIDLALSLNSYVLSTITVQLGWRIVRDFANLAFVLGIIVIAFGTILRSQTYGMKQVLWKLIVMAILINFSLAICGVILDVAGIITQFFIDKSIGNSGLSFASSLATAFQPQKLMEVKSLAQFGDAAWEQLGNNLNAIGVSILSIFFVIFFTWMGVIAFFALAIMLIIRFLYISFLLILAPMAWLGWVFPGLRTQGMGSIWDSWWNEFIRWTFFAPIVSFFLYLAIYTMRVRSEVVSNALDAAANGQAGTAISKQVLLGASASDSTSTVIGIGGSANANIMVTVGEMILFLGLLLGGLMVANKMGIYTAKTFQSASEWLGKKTGNWIKNMGIAGYQSVRNRVMTAGTQTNAQGQTTSAAQRAATRATQANLFGINIGRAFRGAAEGVDQRIKDVQSQVDKEKDKAAILTQEDLAHRMRTANAMDNPEVLSGYLLAGASKGLLNQVTDQERDRLFEAAVRTNSLTKLLDNNVNIDHLSQAQRTQLIEAAANNKEVPKLLDKVSFDRLNAQDRSQVIAVAERTNEVPKLLEKANFDRLADAERDQIIAAAQNTGKVGELVDKVNLERLSNPQHSRVVDLAVQNNEVSKFLAKKPNLGRLSDPQLGQVVDAAVSSGSVGKLIDTKIDLGRLSETRQGDVIAAATRANEIPKLLDNASVRQLSAQHLGEVVNASITSGAVSKLLDSKLNLSQISDIQKDNLITAAANANEMSKLLEKTYLGSYNDTQRKQIRDLANQAGVIDKVQKSHPSLVIVPPAPVGQPRTPQQEQEALANAIKDIIEKIKPNQISDVDASEFNNVNVAVNLTPTHINRLTRDASPEQKRNIRRALDGIRQHPGATQEQRDKATSLFNIIRGNPAWQ